jgi:nicotinamide riboside kinase
MSRKIVFIGAPGSGKSTLAAEVFTKLKQRGRNAELVDEFVRRDIQRHGPMRSIWEQYRTRATQKEIEDAVPATVQDVVVDSGTLTPFFYACLYASNADARQRLVLQDMYRYLTDDLYLGRYSFIFYLPFDPTVSVDDGTRFQTSEEIGVLDAHMDLFFTMVHRTPITHRLAGPLSERIDKVMALLCDPIQEGRGQAPGGCPAGGPGEERPSAQ